MYSKEQLLDKGRDLLERFCKLNKILMPEIRPYGIEDWHVDSCAYYRPEFIAICVHCCANPCAENAVRHWSWPGNTTDRTPYGVLAHELGHHCDYLSGSQKFNYSSDYSANMEVNSGEQAISGYCPNSAEWFAEMFRLFVTNPLLLQKIRPRTFKLITKKFKPLPFKSWKDALLLGAHDRVIKACENKIKKGKR